MDVADGRVTALEIAFSSLLDQLACDHPFLDLSSYTLEGILGVTVPEGATPCTPTPSPLVAQSSEALPIILEDQPLEAVDVEAEREMDAFIGELNEVLTFDDGVLDEGEITTISSDP